MKLSLFQGIVIAVFALAALVGLFVFATFSGSAGKSGIGTVVIWGTFPQAEMQSVLVDALKTNQQLKGVSYVQKDPSTFEQDIVSAIAAGDPPDAVIISQEDLLTLSQVITPIPASSLSTRSFENAFTDGSTIYLEGNDAGSYALPYLVDPLVLYYNKALLSSSNVAEPPSTWEALAGLVPQVTQMTPGGEITQALIALGSYGNVHDARAILSALFLQTGVPITGEGSGGTLAANFGTESTESGEAPGDAVVDFYTQFTNPSLTSYTWNDSMPDSQTAFVNDSLALYLGYASEASFIAAANPNLAFDVAPIPERADGTSKVTYGQLYAFAFPHGGKNTAGALSTAYALLNPTLDTDAAQAMGIAPALKSDLATVPADPIADVAYASALYTEGWLSPAPASVDQVFSAMIESVESGQSMTGTAVSTAQSALSALLPQ